MLDPLDLKIPFGQAGISPGMAEAAMNGVTEGNLAYLVAAGLGYPEDDRVIDALNRLAFSSELLLPELPGNQGLSPSGIEEVNEAHRAHVLILIGTVASRHNLQLSAGEANAQ